MQGKATLILADAKTGREIKRMEEHNMFTNAIKNIFSPPMYAVMHNYNYANFIKQATPIWKNYLGGVMLLGKNVEEDPNNIMAGPELLPVATAGAPYSGTSTVRGTYNENESYPLENGYRLTWDFATDKANGTIRCIALTSKMFGNGGFENSVTGEEGSVVVVPDAGNIYSRPYPNSCFEYGCGHYVGSFEPQTHLFVIGETVNGERRLVFRKYRNVNPSALRINDVLGLSTSSEPVYEHSVAPTVSFNADNAFFVDPENRMLYYFGAVVQREEGIFVSYMGIDLTTLEVTVTRETELEQGHINPNSNSIGAVYKGRLYVMNNDWSICEFTESGRWVRDHGRSFNNPNALTAFNGSILSHAYEGYFAYLYSGTGTDHKLYLNNSNYFPFYNVDFRAPYYPLNSREAHRFIDSYAVYERPSIGIMSNYMATINNLAEPLVKTSEHTLKIRYDITQ